jgi:two-component system sensor histidine kinase/response regulator
MSQSAPNDRSAEVSAGAQTGDGAEAQRRAPAEEWMRPAEQAARPIIVGEPACTVFVNQELIIRDVDAAGAAWAELDSVEQARGRALLDFVAPELHEAVKAAAALVFAGQMRRFRGTAITAKGRRRIVDAWASLASAAPEAKLPGVELCATLTLYDITELSAVEAERDLLASIVRSAHDAIISVSRDNRITSWNPAAEKLYGYSARDALGRGFELYVPSEGLEQVRAAQAEVIATGRTAGFEQRRRRRDGTSFDVWLVAFPTYDAAGNITGSAGIVRDITRQKQTEKELREAHGYTRGLIESSIDAMVVVGRDLRITDLNEQLARLTGLPRKALIGSRFDGYFTDPARAAAAVERTLAEGYVTNYDLVLHAASGKEILVSFNASVFHGPGGGVLGIFGAARDVTEQRATERKLKAERQYSRSLVESSPDALLVSDSNFVLTDVNQQAVRLTGYSRGELVGISLASIFTNPERVRQIAQEALEKGSVHEAELELLTKEAEAIAVSLNASVYRDAEDTVRGVLISTRDIAERKRAERERSQLAAIVSSSGDAIYSVTPDLRISSWNAAAERLFGYRAAEIVGRSVKLLVPLDLRGELAENLSRLREGGESLRYETRLLRKDGNSIDAAIVASPIFGTGNHLTAVSMVARDIGERRRIEEELTKARDAALEAAQARSSFLANMSHEIRTPLNSIIGMTGLLLDTPLNAEQLEFARDVHDSGETLLGLINDILDFSKIAAGRLVFEETDFELAATVEATVEMVADRARHKALELTVSIEPDAPRFLRGDPGRLRQALLNLIDNAIKFTERGEVAVQVGKISDGPADALLRFEVRDTGIGIPKGKLPLLFRPFTQVDASTTRHFGGTGLGLSITRELVERMHGSVSVLSTVGVGSTFWFTARFAKQAEAGRGALEPFPSLAGRRVLIVDDDRSSREILSRQVAAWGMAPEAVEGAQAALVAMRKASRGEPFEVALIDLMMPETDGVKLARTIKGDPVLAKTPLIIISSRGPMSDHSERLRGVEISAWLMKPVPQSPLYNEITTAISRVDRRRRPPVAPPAPGAAMQPPEPGGISKALAARKLRVLVAEDNPINQKLAKLQLKRLGMHADAVADGREAVQAALHVPYDVVLMDCQMPEMDGYDATREIRRREGESRHTKIVAMTAHALAGDREKCLAAGMDDYLSKPVKAEVLEAVLERVFSLDPPRASAGGAPATPAAASAALVDCTSNSGAARESRRPSPSETSGPRSLLDGEAPSAAQRAAPPRASEVSMQSRKAETLTPALDRNILEELRTEGDDFLEELFDMFVAEAPAGLKRITEAFQSSDLNTAGLQAHRLKGSAAGLGAKRLQELCGAVEQAVRANQPAAARALLDQLSSECQRVLEAIAAERAIVAAKEATRLASDGEPPAGEADPAARKD